MTGQNLILLHFGRRPGSTLNLNPSDRDTPTAMGYATMTPELIEAEIATLKRQQENQKRHLLRWGLAFEVAGIILCGAVFLGVALTGEDPPPSMIFNVLTLVAIGLAFITLGRQRTPT